MNEVDPKVDEAIETLNMKDGPSRRRLLTGTGLVSATAAASALLAACSSSPSASAAKGAAGDFPKVPAWKFWFVNHVTTNPFFVPTKYGLADAAALLGIPTPNWGGSTNSIAADMVNYMNTAIASGAAGIAVAVISSTAFTGPVSNAMDKGIPVVSYNADGTYVNGKPDIGTNRLCYVGQALYLSGQSMGAQIKSLIPGGGDVAIFIATPGTGNIQPRYDGAVSMLGPSYKVHEVATGAATSVELNAEKAYLLGNKSTLKGAFAVDYGSTSFLGSALASAGPDRQDRVRRLRHRAADAQRPPGRHDGLHHLPGPVPAGLPAGPVHVPVQLVGRAAATAGHGHGPERHRQAARRSVREEQPVPGRVLGAAVPATSVRPDRQPAGDHQHVTFMPPTGVGRVLPGLRSPLTVQQRGPLFGSGPSVMRLPCGCSCDELERDGGEMSEVTEQRAGAVGRLRTPPPGGMWRGIRRGARIFARQREATIFVVAAALFAYFAVTSSSLHSAG